MLCTVKMSFSWLIQSCHVGMIFLQQVQEPIVSEKQVYYSVTALHYHVA